VKNFNWLASLIVLLLLSGCTQYKNGTYNKRSLSLGDFAKSDVDMIVEVQLNQVIQELKTLMIKLYKRNPQELVKGSDRLITEMVQQVFDRKRIRQFPELQGKTSITAIKLAFIPEYSGDRVLAFIEGMRSMVLKAHNNKYNFYLTDSLDPQKLYNSARNLESAAWKLNNERNLDGSLYLISNEVTGPVRNLSFERAFGKMIAIQDTSAQIMAETTNRRIKGVLQSVASAVFFPI